MSAPWKNVNCLFLMSYVLVWSSLSCLIIGKGTDVQSASSLGCEIKNDQSLSRDCDDANMEIVNIESRVNRNCSIGNGGTTQGRTWEQVNNILKPKAGLVLQSWNLTTRIYLTRALKLEFETPTARTLRSGKPVTLRCHFKGKPLPSVVWHKDRKRIMNGTEGFNHTEKLSEDYQDTLEATLFVPGREEKEGFYNCTAKNSICGWSSEKSSRRIQVIYQCPFKGIQVVNSTDINSTVSSSTSLSCIVVMSKSMEKYCQFRWYFNNTPLPVQAVGKYKTELKPLKHSKCKKQFNLTVINVMYNDEGTYSCNQICRWRNTSANIKLHVYAQPSTSPTSDSEITSPQPDTSPTSDNEIAQSAVLDGSKPGRQLLISYNSKESAWVTENLTPLLNEHSIHYELQQSINQNMADSAVPLSRQLLIVLSEDYPASSFCRKERKMRLWRFLGQSDRPVILVSIGEAREWQLKALSCLGNKTSLEFHEQKKDDWQKKLLDVLLTDKFARL